MPYSPELLSRYSRRLMANSQELCRQAAAACARGAKLRALASEARLAAQTARAVSDRYFASEPEVKPYAMRRRQADRWAARPPLLGPDARGCSCPGGRAADGRAGADTAPRQWVR